MVNAESETARVDDTQGPIIASGNPPVLADSAAEPRRGPVRFVAMAVIIVASLGLAAVGLASLAPSGWFVTVENPRVEEQQPAPYALVPASASSVDEIIDIAQSDGAPEVYPPEGSIYFVTVSEPNQSLLSWLVGRDDPTVKFLTREAKYGTQTPQQQRVLSLQSMQTAEEVAQYVAMSHLGFDAKLVPGEVVVGSISCLVPGDDGSCAEWPPSDDVIDPGDTITEVDGQQVTNLGDLIEVLSTRSTGDLVPMKIKRDGEVQSVEVELTSDPDDPERTIVGFLPFDTATVELPFSVNIDTRSIGGPSAGLAFSLALTDELSEGELTGGRRVAVTGTVDTDGNVGPIGGLVQKTSAVKQTGIEIFLVPVAQGDEQIAAAREVAGDDVEIVPVSTFSEALDALRERGGDPVVVAE